jgi:hypothetical protein
MDLLLFTTLFLAFFLAGETLASFWKPVYSHILERMVFHTLLGLVAVALLTTALAFAGGIYPVTGWIIVGVVVLGSAKIGPALWQEISVFQPTLGKFFGTDQPDRGFQRFNIVILAILVVLALVLALAPPVKTDALVYHLAIPKAYFEHHGIVNLPNNMYSFFPLLFDMVFLFAMTFGVESLPALCGLGMTFLLLMGLGIYFRQYLSPRLAWFVPVLFFSTPTFFEISASAYIDLALAGFLFFTFYAWDRWRETRLPFWFFYMAVFAGAAWATKLTGLIVLPLVVLGIALEGKKDNNPARVMKHIAIFSGIVFLFMVPWWWRNYQYSGNPFLPLLMQFLGGADRVNWDPNRASDFDHYVKLFGMGRGLWDLLLLPYNLTFHAQPHTLRFDGQIGIAFFVLIPALIAGMWKPRPPRWLALSVCFTALIFFWFVYFQYVRFLAPAFTILTLLSIAGLAKITRPKSEDGSTPRWLSKILLGVAACAVSFNLYLIWDSWKEKAPGKYVTGEETRDEYLARNISRYPMYQAMNKLPLESKVLFIYMRNLGYLAERPFHSDSVFEAHTLQAMLARDPSPDGLRRQLQSLGITHLMFDRKYVFGKESAFPPAHQTVLNGFLKNRARLLKQKDNFFLVQLVLD